MASVRDLYVSPICVREFDVLRAWDVTPGMRRVILGGDAISAHIRDGVEIPPVQTSGFDDDVKIMPPDPTTGRLPFDMPRNTETGVVDWTPGSFAYARTYTVRYFDAEAGELAIDFALHETGLASSWAQKASAGDTLLVAGPKHSYGLPAADWMLIGGDETALPAIGHCLEKLPSSLPATVVIEVADPSHWQDLTSAAPVDITWLFRSEVDGASRLVESVMSASWQSGQPYLWVAGETMVVKPLRRWAKRDKGIPKEYTNIQGYWREREVITVEGDPKVVDVAAPAPDVLGPIHEYSELLPPFALRAAISLGVFAEIDNGARTAETVAVACHAHYGAVSKLLRQLRVMGLVIEKESGIELTEGGAMLADPDAPWVEPMTMESVETQMHLSFARLLDVLRTGKPVGIAGTPVARWTEDSERGQALHDEMVELPAYLAPALSGAVSFDDVETVVVVGEGGGPYADVLVRDFPALDVRVIGMPSLTDRILGDIATERRGRVRCVPRSHLAQLADRADVLLAAGVLDMLPDADAIAALGAYVASADRIIVPTRLLDPAEFDDHDAEEDLLRLCVFGSGLRTEDEMRALVDAAGGRVARVGVLGWGAHVIEIRARVAG